MPVTDGAGGGVAAAVDTGVVATSGADTANPGPRCGFCGAAAAGEEKEVKRRSAVGARRSERREERLGACMVCEWLVGALW